jgi:hypothetical protein
VWWRPAVRLLEVFDGGEDGGAVEARKVVPEHAQSAQGRVGGGQMRAVHLVATVALGRSRGGVLVLVLLCAHTASAEQERIIVARA